MNEPTAALLRYTEEKEGTYIVADIGGGTFDVNVLRVEKGKRYTTLATEGQDDLGGREYTLPFLLFQLQTLPQRCRNNRA